MPAIASSARVLSRRLATGAQLAAATALVALNTAPPAAAEPDSWPPRPASRS